ncbi:hypothetical protein ACFX1T_012670 [Malus domestica]
MQQPAIGGAGGSLSKVFFSFHRVVSTTPELQNADQSASTALPNPPQISLLGPLWVGPVSTSRISKMPSKSSSMDTPSRSPRDLLDCRHVRSSALISQDSATTAGYRSRVIAVCALLRLRSCKALASLCDMNVHLPVERELCPFDLAPVTSTTASWVGRNVVAYYPQTLITSIAVGDEVLTTVHSSAHLLLPAIQSLYSALVAANLHTHVKISTPHAASIILDPFPPSQAFFNQSLTQIVLPLLQFLSKTGSPLVMNLYPYYVFMQNKGVVPLDNAFFKPLTPSKEMVDPNTLLHYTNVLDAMIDTALPWMGWMERVCRLHWIGHVDLGGQIARRFSRGRIVTLRIM